MEHREAGGGSPGQALILRCAWCGRIKAGDEWIAADTRAPDGVDDRSDGICPDCHAKLEHHQPL